ncbi:MULTISPECIES: GMC family oxidoreductase N-terminal domain-containing protein [unclassified Caballeronia]|uniref:GMC family oxidoreductase n=1 Tax=unclassified Caballeronia TaxID=2646786 RepID=UPI002028AC30|nr:MULTISPECIES: GMC family oxidoreductase N-terminal domain-containing protein [unclassified Caballeronia]
MSTQWDREADFVIVGGGSAGCVLANRLSASGAHRVLLIEAGPRDRHPMIHIPAGFLSLIEHPVLSWRYRSAPQPHMDSRVIAYPQGRMLGGTGSMNGMLYVRSARAEHARWVDEGCAGWSFDDILPIYEQMENAGGASPANVLPVNDFMETHPLSQAFLDACGQTGMTVRASHNGVEREGAAPFQQNRAGRFRAGPAQTYLRGIGKRANFGSMTDTLAERILFDGTRAVGVQVSQAGRTIKVRARVEVIVACGAIRSPHLLQLSGIGPGSLMQKLGVNVVHENDNVGENLRDHYSVRVTQRVRGQSTFNERTHGVALFKELSRYVAGKGLLTCGASTCAAFARSSAEANAPDLQLSFAPASFEPGTYALEREPGMTLAIYQSYPHSKGSVHAASTDAHAAPVISPRYLTDARDQAAVVAGLKLGRKIFSMTALARYIEHETLPGDNVIADDALLDYALARGVSGYHLVGTCRMGGGEDSVVDPRLRVRGVQGLRVIDASVLPGCTSGNSNAPTIMVAEKGARMLMEDVGESR